MTLSEPLSHSQPVLKSLNLFKFSDIIHYEIFSFFTSGFIKWHLSVFSDQFKQISSKHSYANRQSLNQDLFVPPIQTTQYGIGSLCYTGTNLWNSLRLM